MSSEARMPILEHLHEMRRRMFIAAVAVVVGAIIGFIFRDRLLDLIVEPYERATGQSGLAFFEVGEAFSVSMKVALFGGVILAAPVWLYEIWAFVTPALSKREKRWVIPIILTLVILFVAGVSFAYWTMERALDWLLGFGGDRLTPSSVSTGTSTSPSVSAGVRGRLPIPRVRIRGRCSWGGQLPPAPEGPALGGAHHCDDRRHRHPDR